MRYVIARLWDARLELPAVLTGAVLALIVAFGVLLPKCEGPGPHPFTGIHPAGRVVLTSLAPNACTRAYGQCEVTEFVHVRRDGTHWIETCFAAPPVIEGHGNVAVAVNYCYHP